MSSNLLNKNQQTEQPKKIIDPSVFMAVTLDDISRNLKGLNEVTKHLIGLNEITNKNNEILSDILKEQIDERDEGEYLRKDDIATNIKFTIIDIKGTLGRCVKGYSFKNDGLNTIYLAHNIGGNVLDVDIDINSTRFESIHSKEEFKISYNRNKIRNIYFKTLVGNSDYRLTLVW